METIRENRLETRDALEVQTPTLQEVMRRLVPELKLWQKISNAVSLRITATTLLWIGLVIAAQRQFPHPLGSVAAFVLIAALQHRMNVIQHEAIHRLFFSNRFINDLIGNHLFGASVLTPHTYREYHFKHHREVGRQTDPDYPGYNQFPTTAAGIAWFLLSGLLGIHVIKRFFQETADALQRRAGVRTYHERRGLWPALAAWVWVGAVQLLIWGIFLATGGSTREFLIFWILPEFTLTRTLMAVRLMGEHTTRGEAYSPDVRNLITLPCGALERFFFSPLNFNCHAEHHLVPSIPWHRLPAFHRRMMRMREYRSLVEVRPGYLWAIFNACTQTA